MRGLFILLIFISPFCWGQVGINTTNPQQALHIAGATGTLRVESLNSVNNSFNGGDVNRDLDLTNDTFPLYIDENGNFTLELKTIEGSEELDAFDDGALPTTTATLTTGDLDGEVSVNIKTYSITATRASILEVKYALSYEVYLNALLTPISDNLSRRIQTHILVTGQTREYGSGAKCYTSGSASSVTGTFYNSSTTYIPIPAAGTYDITFVGTVSSDVKSGGPGTTSKETYVKFATANDFVFMRLY